MSFDPNQNAPLGTNAPKKSGALKWILGGLGCFGLVTVLCLGGFGYFSYVVYQDLVGNSAFLQGKANIETSEAIGEAVGNPVTVGDISGMQQTQNGQRFEITYQVPFSGPNGSGTATIEVEGQPMTEDWNLESVKAEVGGNEIPLDGDSLDINIEGE